MLTPNQEFQAPDRRATLKDITVGIPATVPATGAALTIAASAPLTGLGNVTSIIGLYDKLHRYALNNLTRYAREGGNKQVSIKFDGLITEDASGVLILKMAAQNVTRMRSHVLDDLYKLCRSKLIETSQDGRQAA